MHVPQIIKKHTHTRTIYKHHFVKPKSGKSLSHSPSILQSISASPSSLKLSSSGLNVLKAIPTLSESESIALGLGKNVWRPSASEYRASELNYVPKKMKVPKKKNPFKMLEVMAEAHAEGHEIPPHFMKKLKPSHILDNENSETSEYMPDYMLTNPVDLYNSDDNSASDSDSSKADLIYVAPQNDKYKAKKTSLYPSKVLLTPTLATALSQKGKKTRMTYDWIPGTISTSLSSTSSTASDSRDFRDSDSDESDIKHTLSQMLKRNKLRKPKRILPPFSPSEDHINILQMTRKPISITNFTKFKNRLSAAASTLNTSI